MEHFEMLELKLMGELMLEFKLMGELILFLKKSKKVLLFEHLDITLKLKYF